MSFNLAKTLTRIIGINKLVIQYDSISSQLQCGNQIHASYKRKVKIKETSEYLVEEE